MKKVLKCDIVTDLLPNYIEGLTNENTTLFIKEHINNCESCKERFNNMIQEVFKNNNEQAEINIFKKYKKKLLYSIFKGIALALSVTFFIYLVIVFFRYNTINDLNEKYKYSITNSENVYIKITTSQINEKNSILYTDEYWFKDGILKIEYNNLSSEDNSIIYIDYNNNEQYIINEADNLVKIFKDKDEFMYSYIEPNNIIENITEKYVYDLKSKLHFSLNIFTRHIYKTNASYIYNYETSTDIYNRDTGLIEYESIIADKDIYVKTYQYEFNSINENDVKIPDLSKYKILE